MKTLADVSIVSIQTDQSRLNYASYDNLRKIGVSIVSIQTDQSRLGLLSLVVVNLKRCFNRINPNRSIPTMPQSIVVLHN